MKKLEDHTALIVEPHSGMPGSLRNMLNLGGITEIDNAVSSSTAIRALRKKSYDLILCEYALGEGQDGQQLLEDLRHNKIIPLWTAFIMVTGERSYEKVVSAAELSPTDYILKPFAAEILLERVARAVNKQTVLSPIYELMENGNLRQAIKVCEDEEARYRRYAVDFMRLRAELHVALGEPTQAETIYELLAATKAVGWARLGLAKTLFMQERFGEAEELLTALVTEKDKFMDAYDWLAKTHEAKGQLSEAQSVLAQAVAISPHAVRRLRKLGEVALQAGDMNTAERSFQQVVAKAKYSEFRDPEDHVRLVKTLVTKGDAEQAASVVRDLEKSLKGQKKMPACRAISAALVHAHTGDTARAAEELDAAVAACRESVGLSDDMKMELAKNCLQHNLDAGASEIMLEVMSNASNSTALAKAASVFEQAGRTELAGQLVEKSREQVNDLVLSGVEKAKQGDYQGAVDLMGAAVKKLPENPQVVFNAAVAFLKYLENIGWDLALSEQLRAHIETARRLDPTNPKLVSLNNHYQEILKKFGIDKS
ncbi:MAG: tetratricopeptide repeat protein [Pseudomonadota bacterium]